MSEKGLTNISLKKINKSKVYQYIYRKKTTSKLQIVQELQRMIRAFFCTRSSRVSPGF